MIRVRRRRKTVHKSGMLVVGEVGVGTKWLVGSWRR